jgi:hypothetical protein
LNWRYPKNYLQSARELVYKSLDAADQADVKRQALIILNEESLSILLNLFQGQVHTDGNALIPARSMAMTKGDAAAVPEVELKLSPGSLDGTRRPMIRVPQM